MSDATLKNLETQMSELLDSEHQMLLSADFEKLRVVAEEKEKLVALLSERGKARNPALTTDLQNQAKRNARLYEAAILGLKLATDRLSDLRASLGELKTYDDRGLVTTSKTGAPSVSIKA